VNHAQPAPVIGFFNSLLGDPARSSAGPVPPAFFPTRPRSPASSAQSCWNRTASGRSSGPATWPWKPSHPCAIILPSRCPPRPR